MAYNDSDQLDPKDGYDLGNYEFSLEIDDTTGGPAIEVTARCKNTKTNKYATKTKQFNSDTEIVGWYVEVEDTIASVYVSVQNPQVTPDWAPGGVSGSSSAYEKSKMRGTKKKWAYDEWFWSCQSCVIVKFDASPDGRVIMASASPGTASSTRTTYTWEDTTSNSDTYRLDHAYTYAGKTVYYTTRGHSLSRLETMSPFIDASGYPVSQYDEAAWSMIYGGGQSTEDVLVGRFAIDLEDAGGTGDDSDWDDPGDEDPPSDEPDPPTYTLHLDITGALSGRHNDPLNDTSYSYTPADKETVPDYGCGGDGGHGGGGGAGASTIIVHKFATNKANSKEITAIAKRHGYGSGGGKGGKGGTGVILIYY